jgi:hypothetical protein
MPRYRVARKDVISCDKPRGGANNRRSADIRMGQPGPGNAGSFRRKAGSEPREVKHLSTLRKRKRSDSLSSGERRGKSLNLVHVEACKRCALGVAGCI